MKKILMLTIMAVAIIFISGQNNQAEAREVNIGKYWHNYDEYDVYLWIESVEIATTSPLQFSCKARSKLSTDDAIQLSKSYTFYEFYVDNGKLCYDWRMDNGFKGTGLVNKSSSAKMIYKFVLDNL